MTQQKIATVLFDLDGTLLDTAPDLAYALNQLLALHQQEPLSLKAIRNVVSFGCAGMLNLGFNITPEDPQYPALLEHFLALYEEHITRETRPFAGIDTVLEQLDYQGIRWGIVTNKAERLAKQILGNLNLLSRSACVVGGDTTPHQKPNPTPLHAACEMINADPDATVYIGDNQLDIEAARRASMRNIAALYGYVPESSKPESWGADYYIDRPLEILDWLEGR